jgi:basic amino acid/polyamine antiporter, APA family
VSEVARSPLLGFPTASAVVVASMIGVGVFSSLSFQVHSVPSGFAILLLWALGALVALCGAFCYAELGAALPRSGGEYHLLSRIFHPSLGFLAGWVSLIAGFAAPIAAAAIAFSAYAQKLYPPLAQQQTLLALGIVAGVSVIHASSIRFGARFQVAATLLKLMLMLLFAIAAFLASANTGIRFSPSASDWDIVSSAGFATSFVYVSYAYIGWNSAIYLVSETKRPQQTLPRVLIAATLLVALMYLLVNYAFLKLVPKADLLAVDAFAHGDAGLVRNELAVGFLAGKQLFGAQGGAIIGALIALCLVSTISAMVFTGPRVITTMAQDYSWLRALRPASNSAKELPTPARALLLQYALIAILILSASFEAVLQYIGMTLSVFTSLVVLGLFRLRLKEPALARPFRCPGYPITPGVFLAANAWMLFHLVQANPSAAWASVATVVSGLLLAALLPAPQAHALSEHH